MAPPPRVPVDADGDWRAVALALGFHLPDDYEDLVRRYGLGAFDDVLLWTPFTGQSWGNLVAQGQGLVAFHEPLRSEYPEDFPYPLYPEPGGLLEWASTGDGDRLCWLIEGEPNGWPVVEWNIREGAYRHDVGAVEFLRGYLAGTRRPFLLRTAPPVPWFDPYRHRVVFIVGRILGSAAPSEQYRALRAYLGPTADRSVWDGGDGNRDDRFKALDYDWIITYSQHRGEHSLGVFCPPAELDDARAVLRAATLAIGCDFIPIP